MDRTHLCMELERIGKVSDGMPSADLQSWSNTLDELIAEGPVVAAGERVAINRDEISKDSNGHSVDSQGMLF